MIALDYILANYQYEKYQDSLTERSVLKALVHTLNKEELHTLQKTLKRGSSKWSVGKGLYEEAAKVLGKQQPHRNESIAALLKAFTNKQSGKVAEARTELRDRFDWQDYHTQRKILTAFLSSGKEDRMWGCNRLRNNWDNAFYDDVKTLWEQYHEKECAAVVIRHFPMKYVYDNMSTLDIHENYTHLCIKLIHYPKFQIDQDKLKEAPVFSIYNEVEYLYILAKSKSKVEKGFATNTLYRQMATFINTHDAPPKYMGSRAYIFERHIEERKVSTKYFDFVSGILWCMGELGLVEELIAFEEWDNKIKTMFYGIVELQYMEYSDYTGCEKELWNLFLQIITNCLPIKYQQLVKVRYSTPPVATDQVKKDTLEKKHVIKFLVDELGLEVEQHS